jgi:metal-sulfur cluster biosynthetic enzyme
MRPALAETDLNAAIRDALSHVYDPCSVAAGRPTSLIDMGMVLDWSFASDRSLTVTLCVTFSGCTMAPHFTMAAKEQLERIEGVGTVRVEVDTTFEWTPERTSAPHQKPTPPDLQPQAWRSRVRQT